MRKIGCDVVFCLNDDLNCNAVTHYDTVPPTVEYKRTAWETVDILHELLHVHQFYLDGFGMLAWPTSHPPPSAIQRVVKYLRDILDNTVVHRRLWKEYSFLPIHNIFFNECRKDLERGTIGVVQNDAGPARILAIAERLWMAEMCIGEFDVALSGTDRKTCEDFLSFFTVKEPDARKIVDFDRELDRTTNLADPCDHSKSQVQLLKKLGLDQGGLYVAKYNAKEKDFLRVEDW